jgi:hypothetical protein
MTYFIGCSTLIGICPDGQLSAIKSARYVLASTEELHHRIQTLTSRVHELEHALEATHDQLLQFQGDADSNPAGSARLAGMTAIHPMLKPHKKRIAKDPREQDSEDEDGMEHPTRLGSILTDSGPPIAESSTTFNAGLEVRCLFLQRPEAIG